MRRLLLVVSLLCLLAPPAAGGGGKAEKSHPDFSGTWVIEREKSDFGAFEDKPLAKADSTLVITHAGAELKVRRTLSLGGREEVKEFTYYTDGRGETNQATLGVGEVTSKSRWEGDKVVSEAQVTRRGQGGPYTLSVVQRWQMSSDRKTLTNTAVISNETDKRQLRLVYRRAG